MTNHRSVTHFYYEIETKWQWSEALHSLVFVKLVHTTKCIWLQNSPGKIMAHTVMYAKNQTCQNSSHDWRDDTVFDSTHSTWDQLPSPKGSIWPCVTPASGVLKLSVDFHRYYTYVYVPPLHRHICREIITNKIL